MREIFLVSSVHKEEGKCTAAELTRILRFLKPEILFQEVPYFKHLNNTVFASQPILEITAISHYLKERDLIQVPVDLDLEEGGGTVFRRHGEVVESVLRMGPELRWHLDQLIEIQFNGGFEFLNNRLGDWMNRRTDGIIEKALERRGDKVLQKYYDDWKQYNFMRDEVMIKNIYSFCHEYSFNRAVFLFGAGHRRSLISKIQKVKNVSAVPVRWRLFRI